MDDNRKNEWAAVIVAGFVVMVLGLLVVAGGLSFMQYQARERVSRAKAEAMKADQQVKELVAAGRQQDAIEKAQKEIEAAATLPAIGQANVSSLPSDNADGAAERPIPEEVSALVPMFIKWAADKSPLPGLPNAKQEEDGIRDLLRNKLKTLYVSWNVPLIVYNEDQSITYNLPYKYDLATEAVSRTTKQDIDDVTKKGIVFPDESGETVDIVFREEVYGNLRVKFALGQNQYDFYFQQNNKGYRAVQQNRTIPIWYGK